MSSLLGRQTTKLGYAYALLILLRVYSTFCGYGYIHPDEWMQSGEPLLSLIQNASSKLPATWEWAPQHAIRSPTSLLHASAPLGWLLTTRKWSGYQLFLLQRVIVLCRSFAVDACIKLTCPADVTPTLLCLLAISASTSAFMVRPFSNACESQMLAICFACVLSFYRKRNRSTAKSNDKYLGLGLVLGIAVAEGLFARFTFAIFALPLLTLFAVQMYRLVRTQRQAGFACTVVAVAAATFVAVCCRMIRADTHVYESLASMRGATIATTLSTRWVIAPINALLYNARTENVAQHGLHPRWLHVAINWPLMHGVSCCYAIVVYTWTDLRRTGHWHPSRIPVYLSACTIVSSLALLSISPHQEPRFLLPLTAPCVIVFGYALRSDHFVKRPRLSKLLIALYVIQHGVLLVLFGFAHQGGLLPSLFTIDDLAAKVSLADRQFVIWRTFNVPYHLVPRLQRTTDLQAFSGSSQSPSAIYEIIAAKCDRTHLVLPAYAVTYIQDVIQRQGSHIRLEQSHAFWPHIDMDHLDSISALARESGWKYATSLLMLEVQCMPKHTLSSTASTQPSREHLAHTIEL